LSDGLECIVSKDGAEVASIMIPVHLMLNRYGISAINSWNGNSVQIDDEGGCILSPQVGAGIKNSDNSFTGIVMGEVKETNQASADVGLLGYAEGKRSIFLDANTGTATFGVNGKGQIIIDPSDNKAELKSGNYSTSAKTGMLIDLTTPQIKFGSGNFNVDANGKITAKGGGTIAGWNIADTSLTKGKVGISSDNSNDSNIAFWAGSTSASSAKFKVDYNGNLTATSGSIGSGSNKITIGGSGSNSAIYSGSKSSYDASGSGFYLGVNGLSLGNNFFVDSSGNLTAKSGSFTGSIYSSNGTIGGWSIGTNALTSGNMSITSGGSISGANWSINSAGLASFSNISVTGGSITLGGATLNSSGTALTEANTTVGGKNIGTYVVNHIEAASINVTQLKAGTINGMNCKWQQVPIVYNVATTEVEVMLANGTTSKIKAVYNVDIAFLYLMANYSTVSNV
jgi:hypothetical protein